jgi:hypothetical protein
MTARPDPRPEMLAANREARIAEVTTGLRTVALALGLPLTPDDRIGEVGLATLIGYSAGGLKHARWEDRAPRCHRIGRRVFYYLSDVAAWIVDGEE